MFKKYIYGLIVFVLLAGCTVEDVFLHPSVEGNKTDVVFSVNVPAFSIADARASFTDENSISQLWLLVFDENGNYLYKVQATPTSATTAPASPNGTFSATLISNSKKKIVHFIANYDCSVIDDAVARQKDERELIASMSVVGSQLVMWQRIELENGISNTTFSAQTVNLIRNMAKITVIDSGTKDAFIISGFSVHRMPTRGTVAPFDTKTYSFIPGVITEPAGSTYTERGVDHTVTGNATTHAGIPPSSSEYVFERENAISPDQYTCVILHGTYNGVPTYYKIDIIDTNNLRLNI